MSDPTPTTRFAVNLDVDTDDTFTRVTNRIGEKTGRLRSHRGMRIPSRADVLRAALTIIAANPQVERAVIEQVRADALRHPGVSAELNAIADDLARLAPLMDSADSQDSLSTHIVPELRDLATSAEDQPVGSAAIIASEANSVARHGAAHGGYSYLRPMLELAERLQRVRDALDPREKVTCPRCGLLVRTMGTPGELSPGLEHHIAQGGFMCTGAGG